MNPHRHHLAKNIYTRKLKSFLVICLFVFGASTAKAQITQVLNPDSLMSKVETFSNKILNKPLDTTYIKSYTDNIALKLLGVNKINYFRVWDRNQGSFIKYRPDRRLNLGAGIAYKWFALDLVFNVGIDEDTQFTNKNMFDFQATIFNNKQYISLAYQYYFGYQVSNIGGVPKSDYPTDLIRDDVRTVYMGLSYTFAFNYDKFSLKASFIQNEIQLKSAGSFLIGASFNMFDVVGDSSIVPTQIQNYFDPTLYLTDMNSTSLGVNFGYMYTLVWKKHFYLTLSLMPGIGLNMGDYKTVNRSPYQTRPFFAFSTMNAIGYNSKKYFGGISLVSDAYTTRIVSKQTVVTGHGKIRIFLGVRLNNKKK